MIKRVLGIIFTVATVATIILAALEWGNYRSMLFDVDLFGLGVTSESYDDDAFAEFDHEAERAAEPATPTEPKKKAKRNAEGKSKPAMQKPAEGEPIMIDGAEMIDGAAMINGEGVE